ncbi:MAG: hypothetical protein IPP29_16010 [Bacteroidetes bacterium]|nr:hypothetical protein [Bacteroidota bacterium]
MSNKKNSNDNTYDQCLAEIASCLTMTIMTNDKYADTLVGIPTEVSGFKMTNNHPQ